MMKANSDQFKITVAALLLLLFGVATGFRAKRSNIPCGSAFTPCQRDSLSTQNQAFLNDPRNYAGPPSILTKDMIDNATKSAKVNVDRLFNQTEPKLRTLDRANPAQLWSAYTKSFPYAKELSYSALISIEASKRLRKVIALDSIQAKFGLPKVDLSGTSIAQICPPNPIMDCVTGKYRAYAGYCNNVDHEMWGAAFEPFYRYGTPDYADDLNEPRKSKSGSDLPGPHEISRQLFKSNSNKHQQCTLMLAQWMQFIYDDISYLGAVKTASMQALDCCNEHVQNSHPECYPLRCNSSEPDRPKCVPYSRISPAPGSECQLGPREQVNMATSYLDGSAVYGNTNAKEEQLRDPQSGLGYLQGTSVLGSQSILPTTRDDCPIPDRSCFDSGSENVNLLPTNLALHTIWYRQHNRLADELKRLNPNWDDEKLFQESRRILGAQIQHITYKEFLPILIGTENMQKYGVELKATDYYSDYDMSINPNTLNVFAGAVGFLQWSMLPDRLGKYRKSGFLSDNQLLSDYFYTTDDLLEHDALDGYLRFLLRENIEGVDLNFTSELTEKFLKIQPDEIGYDLPALIVHLGRDMGIASYTAWRQQCGLSVPTNFDDLRENIRDPDTVVPILKQLYETVDDLDLFVMGLAEQPTPGTLVGPTFACILGVQFQRLRRSDRFWYENFFFPSSFTEEQLKEIRKTTLARIICDNTDDIGEIQPHVFSTKDMFENCPISCDNKVIPEVNLTAWIDVEAKVKFPITKQTLEKAIKLGVEEAKERGLKEIARLERTERGIVQPGQPEFTHASVLKAYPDALDRARVSEVLLETTKILVRGKLGTSEVELFNKDSLPKSLDVQAMQRLLPQIDVSALFSNLSANRESCNPKPFPCDHTTPYRTFGGWCNNLRFPHYGNTFNPFRRLLDPAYNDGFDEPRKLGSDGRPLPSPRLVANFVHSNVDFEPHVKYSHMLMQFAQILDHDFTHSPVHSAANGSTLNCSRCDSAEAISVNCIPFEIPRNDPHFPANTPDGTPICMGIARSLLGQVTLGYREQINQLTAFIDASTIYGSTECQANSLRLFDHGKLNFTRSFEGLREGLPQGFQEKECRTIPRHMCFVAGDSRSNEQTALAALHTAFLREHNRIAEKLHEINLAWSDERIFQETRRIIGAIMQHITFSEFLPKILGMEVMEKNGLLLERHGYYKGYDPYCDASVSNEFATAAFRFGHTLIRSVFPRMNNSYQNASTELQLRNMFFNATPLYDSSGVDSILMGLAGYPADDFNRHITADVRHHLFQHKDRPFSGMDLPAINIQRARDHGIQPYIKYRKLCGLSVPNNFDDLNDTTAQDGIDSLRKVYRSVEDIDLFPGLMTEKSVRGGLLGPTMGCIVADQMKRARKCDRFWYENDDSAVRFTPSQLSEIRKTSLAKIVCSNGEIMQKMQPKIFDMPDELLNNPVPCNDLPEIDLYEWLDRQFCTVSNKIIQSGKASRITPCISCTCTTEGPECNSVRVDNCFKLIDEFDIKQVTADTACVIQCSAAIKQRSSTAKNEFR